jgi:hypothetical protein
MAYATVADMREFLPRIEISDTTSPSTAQVERQLDLVSAKIDGILSAQGYSVPVSATDALDVDEQIQEIARKVKDAVTTTFSSSQTKLLHYDRNPSANACRLRASPDQCASGGN